MIVAFPTSDQDCNAYVMVAAFPPSMVVIKYWTNIIFSLTDGVKGCQEGAMSEERFKITKVSYFGGMGLLERYQEGAFADNF